ncbi:succinate-semialdehyde dehydrogenase [Paenibacillus beijingensis]|uniref:Succinate-semialdehyde dehydrogenase n=1 Tax=Paenibacillus beijingensis TaxID=1126833 RepID=A0A0D5NRL7_9BACL|nr:succinate-semialdehyde dehydrogenase [Paenibacillus beijingensis]
MEKRKEEVAYAVALEQGKPYNTEALGEVTRAVEGFANASEHIKWFETSVINVKDPTKRVFSIRQPKGVYGVITPWNFPINIPVEYIAPALAAGNAVVWLPAPSVSYSAWKLMECIIDADLPSGAVNFITGPGSEAGDGIVIHPEVNGIGFTGSTKTGNIISQRGAGKHMILELGGNGPTIIADDAELNEQNLTAIASSCFSNAGQICTAAGRIIVHQAREYEVVSFLARYAQSLIVGESFDQKINMGPMHNEDNCSKLDTHIADAVNRGAEVVFGGRRLENFKTRLFYQPTVLRNVHPDSLANCEESFGPLAPVVSFSNDRELKEIVSKSSLGLSSAIFTSNINKAFNLAESMKTGIVNINDRSNYWELHIPFGGISGGSSGRGRLGGMKVLEEMTDLKTITFTIQN